MKKFLFVLIVVILVFGGLMVYWRFYYSFGEGNKSGLLIQFMKKGYIFKTYEGEIIQAVLRSYPNTPVATKDFTFSVSDPAVADSLMGYEGKEVVLYYTEYFVALPWRGHSNYV